MLGKLLKHELRATGHTMLPLFGLLLLVSVLTNLALRGMNGQKLPVVLTVICVIILILFTVGMLAVGVVTVFAMVQRFRNSLLRDEGYIMHTLPVSIHAHIWAKVIVSGLWYTLATVEFVLASMIVAADAEFVHDVGQFLGKFMELLGDIRDVEMLAELLGLLILSSIFLSLMIYASLAVGHSLPSKKMLWSNLVFIGLILVVTLLSNGAADLMDAAGFELDLRGSTFMAGWRLTCAADAGYLTFFSAIFYVVTVWFMKHRLNLE